MKCKHCGRFDLYYFIYTDDPQERPHCRRCWATQFEDFDSKFLYFIQLRPLSVLSERPVRHVSGDRK